MYRYHSTATAALKPLPSPLPDLTATRWCSGKADSTSCCLAQSSTPSTCSANSTGEGPDRSALTMARQPLSALLQTASHSNVFDIRSAVSNYPPWLAGADCG